MYWGEQKKWFKYWPQKWFNLFSKEGFRFGVYVYDGRLSVLSTVLSFCQCQYSVVNFVVSRWQKCLGVVMDSQPLQTIGLSGKRCCFFLSFSASGDVGTTVATAHHSLRCARSYRSRKCGKSDGHCKWRGTTGWQCLWNCGCEQQMRKEKRWQRIQTDQTLPV